MVVEKCCTECGETKSLDGYARSKKGKHGREAKCKSCCNARGRARRQADPDGSREYMRHYMREWHEKNPGARKRIRDDNLGSVWAAGYRRRARRFGFEPVVEPFTREELVETYGDRCWHCGEAPFEELDHHPVPVSVGGPHTLENARPSCTECNRGGVWRARRMRAELLGK